MVPWMFCGPKSEPPALFGSWLSLAPVPASGHGLFHLQQAYGYGVVHQVRPRLQP